jgi:hypothetical protein
VRFKRKRSGVRVEVDEVEVRVLNQLVTALLGVVEAPEVSDDPLAALVGMPAGDIEPPDNPLLQRLLPDAYADDPAAAGEFRRFTDADLRAAKRAAAMAVVDALPEGGGTLELGRDEVDQWLTCFNDLRLLLGTAIGVTEDDDHDEDPDTFEESAYRWLTHMQEWLLSCVDPRPPS